LLTSLPFFTISLLSSVGLVQQFVRYPNVSRSLSHYYAGLETGDLQSVGLMVTKVREGEGGERGIERESVSEKWMEVERRRKERMGGMER
jgi:hypothetical protein